MSRARAVAVALAAVLCLGAAADPAERLANPAQEARARALFRQVRCLVCQNESIDDSEAALAADLRRIVREQIAAGRSDREVLKFLTDRYGEFVLFKPRFSAGNALLWLTPGLVIALGGAAILVYRRQRSETDAPLSAEEQERLARLTHSPESMTLPQENGHLTAKDA